MAAPVPNDVALLNYVDSGELTVNIPAKSTVKINDLSWVYAGQLIAGNDYIVGETPAPTTTFTFFPFLR